MRLFLTSKGLEPDRLAVGFASFTSPVKNIVLITTAALHYKAENRNIIELRKRLSRVGERVHLLDVELEPLEILRSADLIAIGGGNPYYLLHWLRKSGAADIIREAASANLPIFATSAGAIVLGPSLELIDLFTPEMNTVNLSDKNALSILEYAVLPHYDRFIKNGMIQETMVAEYEANTGIGVIRLNDEHAYIRVGERGIVYGP